MHKQLSQNEHNYYFHDKNFIVVILAANRQSIMHVKLQSHVAPPSAC